MSEVNDTNERRRDPDENTFGRGGTESGTQYMPIANASRLQQDHQMVRITNSGRGNPHVVIDRFHNGHTIMPGQSAEIDMLVDDLEAFRNPRSALKVSDMSERQHRRHERAAEHPVVGHPVTNGPTFTGNHDQNIKDLEQSQRPLHNAGFTRPPEGPDDKPISQDKTPRPSQAPSQQKAQGQGGQDGKGQGGQGQGGQGSSGSGNGGSSGDKK